MRGQDATRCAGHSRHGFKLGGLRDHPGKIAEPGREPHGSVSHRALEHRLHLAQLLGRRLARIRTHHAEPNTAVPRKMRDVERQALALEMGAELGDLSPLPVEFALGEHLAGFIERAQPLGPDRCG